MNVKTAYGDALRQDTPLLAVGGWEGEALPQTIAGLLEDGDWTGAYKRTLMLYPRGALPARRLLLVGLGKRGAFNLDRLREVAAVAGQRAADLKLDRVAIELPTPEGLALGAGAQALVEGTLLGTYRSPEYKADLGPDDRHMVGEVTLVAPIKDEQIEQGAQAGEVIARAVMLARDLTNRPGNELPPRRLAEAAQAIGRRGNLQVTVLGADELREQGFGGILGVGQGSAEPPRFIIMEHGAAQAGSPTICLVGKGITFDSGGISIKPADGMEHMKMDMGGAAAVLGAMQAVDELKLPLHVVGLVSAAENMPSGTSYKPGDVIKTLSGKSVEVINTDAEGRVVLADALFYAQRYNPAAIIDLATLTGAIMVALGAHATGAMSNDDALAERVVRAGEASGERIWRMPLWDPYMEMVKSDIADVKNSAGRYGGAILAAAFLANFVGDFPWVHLDIASTGWNDAPIKAYAPKGASGVGVRVLVEALRGWSV